MKKYVLMLVSSFILVFGATASYAQDAGWFGYMIDSMTGDIWRVSASSSEELPTLGISENQYIGNVDGVFSASGDQMAYCVIDYPTDGSASVANLYIRNVNDGSQIYTENLGTIMGCRTAINAEGTSIAVALIRYFAGDTEADTALPAWELQVRDATTGAVTHVLTPESPEIGALEPAVESSVIAYIYNWQGDQMIFSLLPYATGIPNEWPAYTWDLTAQTLVHTPEWDTFFHAYLAENNELVYITQDPNLPYAVPMGPTAANNVVMSRIFGQEPITIHHEGEWVLQEIRFIDGGQAVAAHLVQGFDESMETMEFLSHWVRIGRDGQVSELAESDSNGFLNIIGTNTGWLALRYRMDTGYTLDEHVGGTSTRIWESTDLASNWTFVLADDGITETTFPPFASSN